MAYYFITDSFINELNLNVINDIFPRLQYDHKKLLLDYLTKLIDIIAIKFNFDNDNKSIYEHQFRQNKYRDATGLLYMLLPFIDDPAGLKTKNITSLNDLYITKKSNVDINLTEPKYEYCNIQYNRCIHEKINNKTVAKEIQFSEEHLAHNFNLLLQSINTIAHKLYVNWINIRPLDLDTALTTQYYKNTHNNIINNNTYHNYNSNDLYEHYKKYNGMDIEQIYNLISSYLFHDIKNIKWLIYDLPYQKTIQKSVILINTILPLHNAINNISWQMLTQTDKIQWIESFNLLLTNFINNTDYSSLSKGIITELATTLLFFFNKYYDHPNNKYSVFNLNDDFDAFEDNVANIDSKIKNKIIKLANSLINNGEYMYEYIRESFNSFKQTWYSHFYFDIDYTNNIYTLKNTDAYMYENITAKNIYNFAKSFISYSSNNKFEQFPKVWKSLVSADRTTISNRLNNFSTTWFNISRYIKKRYNNPNQAALIQQAIKNKLSHILFDILVKNGLLTEFKPCASVSDYSNLPKQTNDRNNAIQKELCKILSTNEWANRINKSYYFINKKPFEHINVTYKLDQIIKTEKYTKVLFDPQVSFGNWMYTYAMDWISQIGFYHHYLNNRIIYVTGSTGVGKSTQVPKLLLYSLKMIDYKNNAQIACTQPRIPPTVNNAKTIAEQMGVPIETYNSSIKSEVPTNNYFLQYQYKDKSHSIKHDGLSLKIMTDGLLEAQLKNPVLKTMIDNNFTDKNIYDIVIVDEAHEHNKNMDLILTKMRYVAYYNNDVKLVIISATMDDDEPIYRRYYRCVDDNRMFPLNADLLQLGYDRVNIDRRIHISPPKESTQYEITEHYIPKQSCDKLSLAEEQNCINEHAINTALDILKTSTSGDILIFQPGEGEIKSMVEELNKRTPPNVIALPYFSNLSDTKRNMIEKLDKFKSSIVIPKNIPFEADVDPSLYQAVLPGTYSRIIIVGTNIAEASITISTLRFVIDDGIQKTNIYDYRTRSALLQKVGISESSRLQRKGRVGRVAPGTVYYLYPKGSKENNKRQYDISISDLSDKLFDMLKAENDSPYFTDSNDPNTVTSFSNNYKYNLELMIKNQYLLSNKSFFYLPNNKEYIIRPFTYHTTGIDKDTLNDELGSFYIIHPNELDFNRNIIGNITSVTENSGIKIKNDLYYVSDKMNSFWAILKEYFFVMDNNINIIKTEFGQNVLNLAKQLNRLTLKQIICYIYGRKYNTSNDLVKIFSFYNTIRSIGEVISFEEKQIDDDKTLFLSNLEAAQKLYGNCYGDSYGLLLIANDIIQIFQNIMKLRIDEQRIDEIISSEKNKFINSIKTNDFSNMDTSILYNFIQLYNDNKLNTNFNEGLKKNIYTKFLMGELKTIKDNKGLQQFCKSKYLNIDKVIAFYTNYLSINNDVAKLEANIMVNEINSPNEMVNLNWLNNNTPKLIDYHIYSKEELLSISLIHGYGYNLIRNISIINDNYYYINIFRPSIYNVYQIPKLYKPKVPKQVPNNSLLLRHCMKQNLLFISQKDSEEVNFIDNINITLVPKLLPAMINLNSYNVVEQEKITREFIQKLSINKDYSSIKNEIISKYIKTIDSIRNDMVNNTDKSIIDRLTSAFNIKEISYFKDQNEMNVMKGGYTNSRYVNYLINLINR